VWMFEAPLALEVPDLTKQFLKIAGEELKIEKLLAGADEGAFFDPAKLYDVGHSWKHLGDNVISTNLLHYWLFQAAKRTNWSKLDGLQIPIDVVAEEVARQFPGRWDGPFEVGRRGVCFFDPDSTNPTSSIVTEAGMICFSQSKIFYPWAEILGARFVRKFQADKIGGAVEGVYFDGRTYYRKIDGRWVNVAKEDFTKYLKSKKGLSDEKRGKTSSEVTDAEVHVQEHCRVHGALPFLFDERDVVEKNGQKFLNVAYVRAVRPAEKSGAWGELFPWLAQFLDTLFDPHEQLEYFLAWLKRFYETALQGDLQRGQNVFLVGGVNIGKTLLGHRIIGALVGGCSDASDHVVRASEFNKKLCESALWVIDDGQVASDPKAHAKFGEMVKKLAANPTINFRKMYADGENVDWAGRLFCTLNNDNYSLQMIPDLSTSLEDKVLIFNAADVKRAFPPKNELEATIAKELPHFCRWLLEWTPPDHVVAKNRFGVAKYIHEGLRVAALHSGQVGDLLELVDLWVKRCKPGERHGEVWTGSASEWLAEVSSDDEAVKPMASKFTVKGIGRKFTAASGIPGSRIKVVEESHRGHRYSIDLSDEQANPRKTVTFKPVISC
jgi:hypothetical protein